VEVGGWEVVGCAGGVIVGAPVGSVIGISAGAGAGAVRVGCAGVAAFAAEDGVHGILECAFDHLFFSRGLKFRRGGELMVGLVKEKMMMGRESGEDGKCGFFFEKRFVARFVGFWVDGSLVGYGEP
jgi:hypothetical protein